jgi:ABC-type multidrug transport system fused ATPase/permease subunit
MKNLYNKIKFLIRTSKSKKTIVYLFFLLLLTMVLEFLGLGVMVPVLGLIVSDDFITKYPSINDFIKSQGMTRQTLILWSIVCMLTFYLFKICFLLYSSWRQAKFNAELTKDIQVKLFEGYLSQPYLFHLDRNSSTLLYNIQREENYLSHVVQALLAILSDIALILGIFAMLLLANTGLAIFTVGIFLIFGLILNKLTQNKLKDAGKNREFHETIMFKNVIQSLGGVKDVILFGKQHFFLTIFTRHAKERSKVFVSQGVIQQIPKLYFELLSVLMLVTIVVYYIFNDYDLNSILPTLGLFMLACLRVIPTANRMSISFQTLKFTVPVINKLYNEIKLVTNHSAANGAYQSFCLKESIVISQLSFTYPGKKGAVLKDISIQIKKGETIGFLGPSGAGKTTLIDLILGILKPQNGYIMVEGMDIYENLRGWQNQIGYVPQTIYLLDDSIRKNIAFGIEDEMINDDEVRKSLKLAHLEHYVNALPQGLETTVGERGVKLSGGQRQRIGLARALYHNPGILVLDEATSALDSKTENDVMNAIRELKGTKTILIIAHRMSTILHCDRLYVIEDGKVCKTGKPHDIGVFL